MPIDREKLGLAIKQVRILRGFSQVQLAKTAGLSESGNSVAMIERGERSVSLDTLNALAKSLEIPPACLTVLGSTHIKKSNEATKLLKDLQELIRATVLAQTHLHGEKLPKGSPHRAESERRRPKSRRRAPSAEKSKKNGKQAKQHLRVGKGQSGARSNQKEAQRRP
jgi:transcriptional regulator with XRE-family HTH domain